MEKSVHVLHVEKKSTSFHVKKKLKNFVPSPALQKLLAIVKKEGMDLVWNVLSAKILFMFVQVL